MQTDVPSGHIPKLNPHSEPARSKMPAAAHLIRALVDEGVDTFFGVPGGPVSPVFDALLEEKRATLVESRHETNAAFSAIGYYRATGRVPCVIVTAGPGATNVVTGVVSAHLERVPMIVICGDVAWESNGGRLLQDTGAAGINIEAMLSHATRLVTRVAQARTAASQAMAALDAARDPMHPGPSLLVLPIDRGGKSTTSTVVARSTRVVTETLDNSVVQRVIHALHEANRPLLVIGGAARASAPEVTALIEKLGVPFMTTPQAKGIVSEDHPLSLRNCGLAASWWARTYTSEGVDVCLALGTDLDDCAVGPTPPIRVGGRLFHVDLDATVFNRNYETELGINVDLGAFAQMATRLAGKAPNAKLHQAAVNDLRERVSAYDVAEYASIEGNTLAPHRVIADLQAAAGPGARFVTDIGEHMLFALHYLNAKTPDDFTIHLGLGSMASGICSAIGLALGDRSRRVVCICGDGGMQMAGSELLVALKLRLPVVYAVFNDARYNMVHHGCNDIFGRAAAWDTHQIDFVGWAESFGMKGARIDSPGQITSELLDELTAGDKPAVLDIRHDPNLRVRGAGRNEALRHMSMVSSVQ